jgi:hypothetical protein
MKTRFPAWLSFLGAAALALPAISPLHAGDSSDAITTTASDKSKNSKAVTDSTNPRYGLFNWLDHRSSYGLGVFPEPMLIDDSDLEVNEFRLDWFYQNEPDQTKGNAFTMELEKGFGNLTVELEVHYEYDKTPEGNIHGFDNVDIGARYPIYEYVSKSGFWDTTFGVGVEVGIPTTSVVSQNAEFVPKVFNDTKIGNFTMQSIFGLSMLTGPGDDGGLNTFEYGFMFGYNIKEPLPFLETLIPFFELSGETTLNHGESGANSLLGNVGFRFNTKSIGRIQPRIGVGYVFPIDSGGREDLRSGIFTSLVFEF